MPAVKVGQFISSSAAYVRANVRRANADRNPYLTLAEARALPRDLRDNYEAHRIGNSDNNNRVSASKFETKFTDYVAVKAQQADRNGDGYISPSEVRHLPVDLRDNYWNFRNR